MLQRLKKQSLLSPKRVPRARRRACHQCIVPTGGGHEHLTEPLISERDLVIAISQSGETADTLAAVRLAREKGAKTIGIINVVDSTIAREVDEVIYTRAGPEIGVASTKAFLSQLIIVYKLAFHLAGKEFPCRDISKKIKEALALNEDIKKI